MAARNYTLSRLVGRPTPYYLVFLAEVPLWIAWALLLPAIIAFSRRFPPVGRLAWRNAALHIAAGLVTSLIAIAVLVFARSFLPGAPPVSRSGGGFINAVASAYFATVLAFIFIYFSAAGLVLAGSYYSAQQQQRAREAELEALLARSERDLLRMQIHPHFLFNTMHAISAMMLDDVPGARRMMSRLSDLLRMTIEEDAPHLVTLDEEMQLLRCYLDIQRIRFGDRLEIDERVEPATCALLLPRLILQPIVENAIVHGIARIEGRGQIIINSRQSGNVMQIDVIDNGAGISPDRHDLKERIGLTNSRARLQQFFGDEASVQIQTIDGVTITTLQIPARTS